MNLVALCYCLYLRTEAATLFADISLTTAIIQIQQYVCKYEVQKKEKNGHSTYSLSKLTMYE